MRRIVIFCLTIFLFVGFLVASESPLMKRSNDDESRKTRWLEVDAAQKKRLPQTAIKILKEIQTAATAQEKWDEATLAMCYRIFQQSQIEQPGYAAIIKTLQADIPNSPEPMQPMLKAMLAEYIYSYYMQNQWRFRQRSQTASVPSDDIETWDLARILNEVDKHFTDALKSSDELKKIPIGDYDMLLKSGNVDDKHRPTLFDFVAFEAIKFYSLDEQFIRQQGAFEITAESPVFASSKEFLKWKPDTADDDSFLLRAATLIQEVMSFHEADDDQTAFFDADLNRLQFARRVATTGDESSSRYAAALQRFSDQHVDHPLSSLALGLLAEMKLSAGEFVEALAAAEQGLARFPKSKGAAKCQNVVNQVKSKSIQLVTERVWNGDKIEVNLTYKNIDKVWFRLVKFDYANWKNWGNYRSPQNVYNQELTAILKRQPAKAWSKAIPATDDYKQRRESIDVTAQTDGLPNGCYVLISSTEESFSTNKKASFENISLAEVWISELAMVVREGTGVNESQIQILNAISGKPIAGAQVEKRDWIRNGRNSSETNAVLSTTNADGIAKFQIPNNRNGGNQKFFVRSGEQRLGKVSYYNRGVRYNKSNKQTIFFTDRSIYRPGQPIQFKGICYSTDPSQNKYQTLTGQSVSVQLYDGNNQQVETKTFRTNEFGSFTGTFSAPRDRATGYMSLRSSINGQQPIRVEEYKRPKFFVDIAKPSAAFRLGQKVTVDGSAIGYTGAAIDNAKVTWRVTRQVRYPFWCYCRYWSVPLNESSAEIANGESTTGVDGKFTIDFAAAPDNSVDRKYDPIFTYRIVADVTDNAGETRSDSQQIRIGYTSLQASLSANSWLTSESETELKLKVTTLDDEGVESTGKLKIYSLKSPEKIERIPFGYNNPRANAAQDIKTWSTDELVSEEEVTTEGAGSEKAGSVTWKTTLKAGAYKAVFETTDPTGNKVLAELPLLVNDIDSDKFAVKIPNHFQAEKNSVEPGEEFVAIWGTGYETGQAFIEIEHRGKVVKSWWTDAEKTQTAIRIPIEEKHRGGLQLHITYVRDNRSYPTQYQISVPWSNKKLKVKWEHFESKLQPGGRETWTAVVSGPDAESVAAEMVASMYDASLDAFTAHRWQNSFSGFYHDHSQLRREFANYAAFANTAHQYQRMRSRSYQRNYRRFADRTGISGFRGNFGGRESGTLFSSRGGKSISTSEKMAPMSLGVEMDGVMADAEMADSPKKRTKAGEAYFADDAENEESGTGDSGSSGIDLKQVQARKNLKETAFFFPQLQIAKDGTVRIEFEIPEALTKWKFQGFAHDNELKAVLLTDDVTTSKDLMVQPNPPRFLREGDQLEFSVKVSNQSDKTQAGKVQLTFADARTGDSVDESFGNQQLEQTFDIPAKESRSLFWKITVPDFVGALTYKAIGGTETVSDGEEGFLPVLSKRILVTESLPLPIRGNETKTFDFDRLEMAGKSETLQSQSLTVQVASNPSWYAVMSLPYLMNYEHQCSEQTFNRLYANSLGQHIANSDPKIERIFEQWRGTKALDSPLENNEELRNVLLAESPWLESAKEESQARRDVGLLFDKNRMTNEIRQAQNKLAQMQLSDGAWPWFPGGRANDYITLYVTTGYGRLRHLNIDVDLGPAFKALDRLDWWINKRYQSIKRNGKLGENNLSADVCLYLYGRSFFLKDRPVNDQYKTAFDYFVDQGVKHWADLNNRQSQGHLALALKRLGNKKTPAEIMKSLTQRAVQQDELGMYWNEGERSWWWYKAPIETQALMIEAYDEVLGDKAKVEELKIWLLKQKQTQNWKTTKATADACYGLLLRGADLLASDKLVEVKLGDMMLQPESVEAGTGFYEQRFVGGEIKPAMGKIEMKKSDDGIAWGSIHWQYLEDVSKIEPYEGTPLTLKKSLYTKKNTEKGPVISKVDGPVEVGDELVMRVELRVDRAMEFVHLKDYRGSGTEPVNVLSRYKFQDGLMYYESTKDTATHFFIDYLPKGTYVFEYSVRVQHRGKYETGIAELQCMYAPEFNSHSGSVGIVVE